MLLPSSTGRGCLPSSSNTQLRAPACQRPVLGLRGALPLVPHSLRQSDVSKRTGTSQLQRWNRIRMFSGDGESTSSTSTSSAEPSATAQQQQAQKDEDARIKKTLADLDALLGIQEDPKASKSGKGPGPLQSTNISVSSEAMSKLADAEAQRLSGGDASKAGPLRDDIQDQFQKIIEKARRLADEQNKNKTGGPSEADQQQLREEVSWHSRQGTGHVRTCAGSTAAAGCGLCGVVHAQVSPCARGGLVRL